MLFSLRWITSGESHGKGVLAFLEGIPAGLDVDVDLINRELARRQGGYGRGKRMEIEQDQVEILAGIKRGKTLGSPLTLLVRNRDHRIDGYREITRPRPGHADLPGAAKFATDDCADIMERASARETAGRVAAGSLAGQVLSACGIETFAWVTRIGGVPLAAQETSERRSVRDASAFYSLDPEGDTAARAFVDARRKATQ